MTLFLAGVLIGGALVYGFLRWSCERAYERLEQALKDEIDRS